MGWDSLLTVLKVMGALGIFIFGMKMMSDSIQKIAGNRLRELLAGMTRNRFAGILTGFATTALVQSSSATTVMVVSFVNAGLLTLVQSTGVIMGANIGTTVTAWIVSYFGFSFKVSTFALYLVGIFLPLLFSKREKLRTLAEFVFGFGILFQGLQFLKDSVPDIKNNPEILQFLQPLTEYGYLSIFLFILVGTLLTVIVQSSSATMTITMVTIAQGWIPFEIGAAIVLGENIGTTVTANIAAVVGNVHARRAARFHTVFNVIGITWMLLIFPFFLEAVDWLNQYLFHDHSVFEIAQTADERRLIESTLTDGLALYHTMFNVLNTLLLLGFAPLMARFVISMTKAKNRDEEGFKLQYISRGLMSTPELSVQEAMKEVQQFSKLVEKMCANVMVLLFKTPRNKEKLQNKIGSREEITDRLQNEITRYMARLGEYRLSERSASQVKSMIRMSNDLERMGDIFYMLSLNKRRMDDHGKKMPASINKQLEDYFDLIYKAIKEMNKNMALESQEIELEQVYDREHEINRFRDDLKKVIYDRIENGQLNVEDGILYLDFVNSAEKLGDHIVNINQALAGIK